MPQLPQASDRMKKYIFVCICDVTGLRPDYNCVAWSRVVAVGAVVVAVVAAVVVAAVVAAVVVAAVVAAVVVAVVAAVVAVVVSVEFCIFHALSLFSEKVSNNSPLSSWVSSRWVSSTSFRRSRSEV